MFGTSGIRKVFKNYGGTEAHFTPEMALKLGLTIGSYINGGVAIIGKDIRTAALPIEHALIAGLISTGCKVKTVGIVTTPTLAMSCKILNGDCGIMITASHSTPEYIGVKLWNPSGLGFSAEQEETIEDIYNKEKFNKTDWRGIGSATPVYDLNEFHVNDILEKIKIPRDNHLHLIVDPGNGSSCDILPIILNKYNIKYMTINAQMDGSFPGRLSEPNKENLNQLSKFVKISDVQDIGIALDGDADRVIFIAEDGKLVDPIRLLALCAKDILTENGGIPEKDRKIATPINSSSLLERLLEPLGYEVIRTEVGDIKVATALKEKGGILGGETSGTYIWPKYHYGPDSLLTIAYVLEMINRKGKPLRELLKEIPDFPFVRESFQLKEDIPFTREVNEKIITEMNNLFQNLGRDHVKINKLDGFRFDYQEGWVMVRRSGTTPKLRISVESTIDIPHAEEMLKITQKRMEKLGLIKEY